MTGLVLVWCVAVVTTGVGAVIARTVATSFEHRCEVVYRAVCSACRDDEDRRVDDSWIVAHLPFDTSETRKVLAELVRRGWLEVEVFGRCARYSPAGAGGDR